MHGIRAMSDRELSSVMLLAVQNGARATLAAIDREWERRDAAWTARKVQRVLAEAQG